MKLYVASSWKNDFYYPTVKLLEENGHSVLDWRKNGGFHWSNINPDKELLHNKFAYRDQFLTHHLAVDGFNNDYEKMEAAYACVLLLPCGRSAHFEAGHFWGKRKPVHIYIPIFDTPELMYKGANSISFTEMELLRNILEK